MKTLCVLAFAICTIAQAQSLPLTSKAWSLEFFNFGGPPPSRVKNLKPTGIAFDLPSVSKNNFLDYALVIYSSPLSLSGTLSVTLSIVTSGTPIFRYDSEPFNTCPTPAHVRPYFDRITSIDGNVDRWWANPNPATTGATDGPPYSYVLAPGSVTLTIPLQPQFWSDTSGEYGDQDSMTASGFASTVQNIGAIGLSFGGGCFFGHGVNVSNGTAQVQILSYSVSP